MSKRMVIDLLRHGACSDGDIYRGRTDSALSARGWEQMQSVMAVAEQAQWQSLYSSPLQRCLLPAKQFAERLGLPLQPSAQLREIDFGDWDGQLQQRVWEQRQDQVLAFWSDPLHHPPPGGESIQSLQQRLQLQLRAWLQDFAVTPTDSRLLCVTHAGVIRTLLCQLLGMSITAGQQLSIDYGSLTRIELYPTDRQELSQPDFYAQIVFVNRLFHLSDHER